MCTQKVISSINFTVTFLTKSINFIISFPSWYITILLRLVVNHYQLCMFLPSLTRPSDRQYERCWLSNRPDSEPVLVIIGLEANLKNMAYLYSLSIRSKIFLKNVICWVELSTSSELILCFTTWAIEEYMYLRGRYNW